MNICHQLVASLGDPLKSPKSKTSLEPIVSDTKCELTNIKPAMKLVSNKITHPPRREVLRDPNMYNRLTQAHLTYAKLNKNPINPNKEKVRGESSNDVELADMKNLKADMKDFAYYKASNLRYPTCLAKLMAEKKSSDDMNKFFLQVHPKLPKKSNERQFIQVDASHFTLNYTDQTMRKSNNNSSNNLNNTQKPNFSIVKINETLISTEPKVSPSEKVEKKTKVEDTSELNFSFKKLQELAQKYPENSIKIITLCLSSHNVVKTPVETRKLPLITMINNAQYLLTGDYARFFIKFKMESPKNILPRLSTCFTKDLRLSTINGKVEIPFDRTFFSPNLKALDLTSLHFVRLTPEELNMLELNCTKISKGPWENSVPTQKLVSFVLSTFIESKASVENSIVNPFVPSQLFKCYPENSIGVGIVCQLFAFLFLKLFVNQNLSIENFTTYHLWFVVENSIENGENLISQIEACHHQISICFKKFKNAFPSIVSAAACIVARHKWENSDKTQIDVVTKGRANLFSNIDKAKITVKNAIKNEYIPPLDQLIKMITRFKTSIEDIITKPIFAIFNDEKQMEEYAKKINVKNIPDRIRDDLENLKQSLTSDMASDSCFNAFKICFSFSEFFSPKTFIKCLLTVKSHLELIIDDLCLTKVQIEDEWIAAFNDDADMQQTLALADNLSLMTNEIQILYDQIEVWVRSSHTNVFIHYAKRMHHGLKLFCEETREFPLGHIISKPTGSKNDSSIPRTVTYNRLKKAKKNEVIVLSDSEEERNLGEGKVSTMKRISEVSMNTEGVEGETKRVKYEQ